MVKSNEINFRKGCQRFKYSIILDYGLINECTRAFDLIAKQINGENDSKFFLIIGNKLAFAVFRVRHLLVLGVGTCEWGQLSRKFALFLFSKFLPES